MFDCFSAGTGRGYFFSPNIIDGIRKNDDSMFGKFKIGSPYIPSGPHMDGQRNWVVNIGPIPYGDMKNIFPEVRSEMYSVIV